MHPLGRCLERGTKPVADGVSGGRTMDSHIDCLKTQNRSVVHFESVKLLNFLK